MFYTAHKNTQEIHRQHLRECKAKTNYAIIDMIFIKGEKNASCHSPPDC